MEREAKIISCMPYDFEDKNGGRHTGYKVGYVYKTDKPMLYGLPCDSFSCSTKEFERYDLQEGEEVVLCGGFSNNGRFSVYGVYV